MKASCGLTSTCRLEEMRLPAPGIPTELPTGVQRPSVDMVVPEATPRRCTGRSRLGPPRRHLDRAVPCSAGATPRSFGSRRGDRGRGARIGHVGRGGAGNPDSPGTAVCDTADQRLLSGSSTPASRAALPPRAALDQRAPLPRADAQERSFPCARDSAGSAPGSRPAVLSGELSIIWARAAVASTVASGEWPPPAPGPPRRVPWRSDPERGRKGRGGGWLDAQARMAHSRPSAGRGLA